jgi:endonuclease/exonuclease/phosphatase family metal-dependent hydrolase
MFYNLGNFGASSTKTPNIIPIIDDFKPDLIMAAELNSSLAADNFLKNGLNKNTVGLTYTRPITYTENTSPQGSYEQFVFYNATKLQLINQYVYPTTVRDINRFTFKILGDEFIANPIFLEVFVNHLQPSDGYNERQIRLENVTVFTNLLPSLPANTYILYSGDLNVYTSNEPAYLELLDPTNAIILKDPIDRPCVLMPDDGTNYWGAYYPGHALYVPKGDIKYFWQDNPDFKDIHTQNPKTNLDDRFDFILTSENILNSNSSLTYVPNSYKAYGNNGNCFDIAINNPSCSGTYSQAIRDALFAFSDHLPVVMELEAKAIPLSIDEFNPYSISFSSSNITSSFLSIHINEQLMDSDLILYNQLGQIIKTVPLNYQTVINNQLKVDVSNLYNGIYIINNQQNPLKRPLRFIKN